MHIFFATSNDAKVISVARVLSQYGIDVARVEVDLPELQAETAPDVAAGKVRAAFALVKQPVMVIDSALHIDALGGFPGTNVKWATKQIGVRGYLDLLWRHPPEARACAFVDAIAYLDAVRASPLIVTRHERGRIAYEPRGNPEGHKSSMATVFIPDGCDKTIAEMSSDEFRTYRTRPETEQFYHSFAVDIGGVPPDHA